MDAVAALAHAQVPVADHLVAAHERVARAVEVDAKEVILDPVALDARAPGRLVEEDAGVGLGEARAGVADGKPAHHDVGRRDAEHAARAAAVEDGAGRAFQGERAPDRDGPRIDAGREPHHRAGGRGIQRRLQPAPAGRDLDDGGRRGAHPRRRGGEQGRRPAEGKRRAPEAHQAVFGFTNMRPRISMCSA